MDIRLIGPTQTQLGFNPYMDPKTISKIHELHASKFQFIQFKNCKNRQNFADYKLLIQLLMNHKMDN